MWAAGATRGVSTRVTPRAGRPSPSAIRFAGARSGCGQRSALAGGHTAAPDSGAGPGQPAHEDVHSLTLGVVAHDRCYMAGGRQAIGGAVVRADGQVEILADDSGSA